MAQRITAGSSRQRGRDRSGPSAMSDPVAELDAFLDGVLPPFLDEHPESSSFGARRQWQRILASGGWVGLSWPEADGGRDLPVRERLACERRLTERGAPALAGVLGVNNVGPTISRWGSPEQRAHLPGILSGEEIWCQGFSEPDAGSDLKALRCRAARVAGGWEIEGQKVWTSAALEAGWCQLLARSEPGSTGTAGITCFLVDLARPGIDVRPLRQMTGDAEFGEVHLDGVRVPDAAVLGPVGEGWKVAMTTLGFERANTIVMSSDVAREVEAALRVARGNDLDPVLRDEVVSCYVDGELLRLLGLRSLAQAETGVPPGPEHTALKIRWSLARQRVASVRHRLLGPAGAAHEAGDGPAAAVTWELLRSRASTIAGGTTEVLRNVVAERVLGLPREPAARPATREGK